MFRQLLLSLQNTATLRTNSRTYYGLYRTQRTLPSRSNCIKEARHGQKINKSANKAESSKKGDGRPEYLALLTLGAVSLNFPPDLPGLHGTHLAPHQPIPLVIDWNTFCYDFLAKGEVASVTVRPEENYVIVRLHNGAMYNGRPLMFNEYRLSVPSVKHFEEKLREFEKSLGIPPGYEVPIVYRRASVVPALIFMAIVLAFLTRVLKRSESRSTFLSPFTKMKFTIVDPATRDAASAIKFKDVAGLQEAKVEIAEFVDYLKNSERFMKLGAKLPKGVLLTGPPGCGKTLLAKAVANEANVPFLALSGSDFIDMIGGVGASRVRDLFKKGKKLAPCIIYIDEIDSIGKRRAGSTAGFDNRDHDQTLNQLLVEMDGMTAHKGIILLASTNRAEVLDTALLRPGRFDRQILIDFPNLAERRELFEMHASKIKLKESPKELSQRIAQLTPGMSGADLANVCNEAALHAARKDKKIVESSDIEYAIERVVAGTEKRSSSISAHERRIIAYHECGHALTGWLLEHTDPILKVTIVPRTKNILGFAQYAPSDRKLKSREELFDQMCMALGGRVAELIKFNHLSTGAQNDLRQVTELAIKQITEFGFDPAIGNLSFPRQEPDEMSKKPYSKMLANLIDQRASLMVRDAFERTRILLSENVDKLNVLAEKLVVQEVLNTKDIEELIGPRPYQKKEAQS